MTRWTSPASPGLHVDPDDRHNNRFASADYVCGQCGADGQAEGVGPVRELVREYLDHRKSHDTADTR